MTNMSKKPSLILGGVLAALLLAGAIGATAAYAQDNPPPAPPAGERGPRGPHFGGPGLDAAAEALGMTTDELTTALKDGRTLEQVAEEAGVEWQTVQDAMQAARDQEMRARIETGLADGTLSQEKADWLLEGLDQGFLDGPGFGFGPGPRGPRPGQVPADNSTDR
jgi:ABC-type sugar transport system substrate-binding protein